MPLYVCAAVGQFINKISSFKNARRALPLLAVLALAGSARAEETYTYSTFGPNYASDPGILLSGSVLGGNNLAVPFIAPITGTVTNISVGTDHIIKDGFDLTDGYGAASHVVTIYSNTPHGSSYNGQSGQPGNSLFSFASPYGTVKGDSANAYFSFDIGQGPQLIAGEQYWIGIKSQGLYEQGQWRVGPNAPAITLESYVNNGGYWSFTQPVTTPAFSVSLVPEPATLSLTALAALPLLRRNRKG